jgi:neutral ceramidase
MRPFAARPRLRVGLLAPAIAMALALLCVTGGRSALAQGWKAGTARVEITPKEPTWMAGYGSRNKPSEGAFHDLWAKALLLEDPEGRKSLLVTLDLCGIGRELSLAIRSAIEERVGLTRDRIVLACSHTHCGPVVGGNLITMYPMNDDQRRVVEKYAGFLARAIPDVARSAADRLEPAALAWGSGRADFAVNRRANKEADVPALRARGALQGPVDHDVPVLRVVRPDGTPLAIVCGYACHCTTLSFYQFCGDYAGFAQVAIEAENPSAQAMFVAGCGADQNPLPRRTVELAERYGHELADAVQRVISGPLRPVTGGLDAEYTEIDLPFGAMPTREQVEADAKSSNFSLASRAKALLATLERRGSFAPTYPYPVQVWRLGDLTWIFLGGEVVVDYSLRLKRNLGSSHTWVSSYCNDVMAYIPSLRVLKEGGYEGATSMIPYGQPTVWGESVEEDIIAAVIGLVGRLPHKE